MSRPMVRALQMSLTIAVVVAAAVQPLRAHLFYLEQRPITVGSPAGVLIDARVGHAFKGDLLPRMDNHIDRFVVIDAEGNSIPLEGVNGHAPAGIARGLTGPGLVLYESRGVPQRLARAGFEAYAAEEGLSHLLEARAPSADGYETETYHRCAKTVIGERELGWMLATRATGCTLELVTTKGPTQKLSLRLLLRGEPLPLALVRLGYEGGEEALARTDESGGVSFDLPLVSDAGKLMVSAVHLEPAPSSLASNWQSWWTSLTLPAANAGR